MKGTCELCGKYTDLQRHHAFGGALRKKAEKYNAVAYLCLDCHTGNDGVHRNMEKRFFLRAREQKRIMQEYGWTTEKFIKEFERNYL